MAIIPDDADVLPPSDDHIFKTFLTHPNAKPVLISVVSTVSELLMEISKDERERAHLRSRKMFETDRISNLLTAEARNEARQGFQIPLEFSKNVLFYWHR